MRKYDLQIHRTMYGLFTFCVLGVFLASCNRPTFRIFEKPVVFDEVRKELSIQYLKERYGIETNSPSIEPRMIVIHWTAIPTLESSYNAMNPAILPGSRTALTSASRLNVAAHFLIDRDGTIFRQLPDTAFARHVIGLNHCAIGVENIGSREAPLTRAQLQANMDLVRYLKRKHSGIEYVIGHYQYTEFENHPLWVEIDDNYRTGKSDPGVQFMKRLHRGLADLGLKSGAE